MIEVGGSQLLIYKTLKSLIPAGAFVQSFSLTLSFKNHSPVFEGRFVNIENHLLVRSKLKKLVEATREVEPESKKS